MSTGNRCAIYDDIAALSEARTVADLVRRLQPILNELAYYGVTGETAVLEAHEEWRTQYNNTLRAESGGGAAAHGATHGGAHGATHGGAHAATHGGAHSAAPARARPSSSSSGSSSRQSREHESRDSRAPQRNLRLAEDLEYESRAAAPAARAAGRTHTPAAVNASGVPRALLAIMSGSHPSFMD